MTRWKAWLAIGVLASLAALLLWLGLAIVVRVERVEANRVDVTVDRRLLGVFTLSREMLADVVSADIHVVWARTSGGGAQRRGSTVALQLTSRNAGVIRRTRFGPSVGTGPYEMADEVSQFLKNPSSASMASWWMPWLVNVAALPFVLIVGAIVGEVLLRRLSGRSAPDPRSP